MATAQQASPPRHSCRLAIIGDVFTDLSATGLGSLPAWGGDVAVERPIKMLPGGSGLNSATMLASLQRDPNRTAITGESGWAGVQTVLHAALGDDTFASFLQEKAVSAGVEMCKITVAPPTRSLPANGDAPPLPAPGTGVCMVLAGYTDSSRTRIDRSFVTHYGAVGAMQASDLDARAFTSAAADHVHISGWCRCAFRIREKFCDE